MVQKVETERSSAEIKTKEDLIKAFRAARAVVFSAIANLEDEDFVRPMEDGQTVKNILAHFVEWDYHEMFRTNQLLVGEEIDFSPDIDNDVFNDQAYSIWQDRDARELVVEFHRSTELVIELLRNLDEKKIFDKVLKDGNVVNPRGFLVEEKHDREHGEQIIIWKEAVGIE